MQTFFRIILIIFAAGSIFFARHDLATFINQLKSEFLNKPKSGISGALLPPILTQEKNITTNQVKVFNPGPLRVPKIIPINEQESSTLSMGDIVDLTNSERSKAGIKALKTNTLLNQSAKMKLDDMFKKQYFEHISPDGKGVSELSANAGYEYIIIGENLALGDFPNNQELISAWMASLGHRANILNPRYSEIGVAVGNGLFDGKETWLAVQHFGLPLSTCPAISDNLKNQIEKQKEQIDILATKLNNLKAEIDAYENKQNEEYKNKIKTYNELVGEYNTTVAQAKDDIAEYNQEVADFNDCVKGI